MNEALAFTQLNMMYFQEALERLCWQQGNMKQTTPRNGMDGLFNRKKLSYDLPESSAKRPDWYRRSAFLDAAVRTDRLSKGFQQFGNTATVELTNEAAMIGVETRISAPVRIVRRQTPCSISV